MAGNPVSRFSTALDGVVSAEQKISAESLSDTLWRESWAYHCDHTDKHLDAIAATNPLDKEIQDRVAFFKGIVAKMREGGMPEIAVIAEL